MREKVRRTLLSLLLILSCQAVFPPAAQAQISKKVTINLVQVPIKDFFNAVKAQTGLNFIMKSSSKTNQRISVNVKDVPATEVLTQTLHQIGCMYEVEDNIVTVTDLPDAKASKPSTRHLTGYVTDTDGQELSWNGERCEPEADAAIDTYDDHRMAMAFAPACMRQPIRINNPQVVSKSYPCFWDHLRQAGARVE